MKYTGYIVLKFYDRDTLPVDTEKRLWETIFLKPEYDIKQEDKKSKLSANKSLSLNNGLVGARYLSEKVDRDEDSFKIFELHEKRVSGFSSSANINKISSNFSSFLFSLDSNDNINRFIKNYDNIYYICKCLLPFRIPVTDISICAGVVPYRDEIIF